LIARDGAERPIADSGAPIRNEDGRITGVVLVFRDQTEQRRAEKALRDSEQRYRSLFENMLDGFAYCQMLFEGDEPRDFLYLDVNPAFKRLTGLGDVVGKRVSEVIPGIREAHPKLFEIYGRVARSGLPEKYEIYLQELGAWLSIAVYSMERDHFVAVFDNITDRKRGEEALRQSERRQAEAEKLAAAGRLAAQVAHEINNPLAGIKNSFRLIRDAVPKDHPDRDMVERVEREIDRIAHIVRQMYELHSPRAQEPRTISVGETIRDVLAMLEPLCREHGVTVEVGPLPSALTAWVPEGSLQQILYNLTVNAIQASPPRSSINIFVNNADNDFIEILIRDRGHGISPEIRDRIFEPFFSTDSANSIKKGLGLGLSIVKTIIGAVGGKIDFETAVDQGTCFRVCLPCKPGVLK
jgi:PAS domain S-box-containing protein